ncbi:MAG: DUF5666 domain-containing protein, partial [Gaiellaceae bacterium]
IDDATGQLQQQSLHEVGQSDLVSLDGTISSLAAGSLVLAVENGPLTTISIPASITLPSTIAAGDRVELLAQVSAGTFTLVTLQDDHAATPAQGTNLNGEHEVEAEGAVTALSATSLTVLGGEQSSPIVFAIPAGLTLPAVAVGDPVDATGTVGSDGTVTLTSLEVKTGGEQHNQGHEIEAEGAVTAVSAGSLTVQPHDGGTPIVFTVPAGFDVSAVAVGDAVTAQGTLAADGSVTLAKLEVHGADSGGGSGSDSGGGSGSGSDSGSGSGSTGSGDSGGSGSGSTGDNSGGDG